MAASTGDKITDVRLATRPNSARVTSPRGTGVTSLSCDNLSGWPTASKVHFVTYQIDSSSNPIAGTQLDCSGIVSSNTIGSFTVIDGVDTGNSVNDVVEMLPTAAWAQDLADWGTNQHTRTGAHTGITTDTITVTSGTTLPAGDIGTADIAALGVTFAKLASDIFSGQVQTQANAGSAGGNMWWINLGGIKILWGTGVAQAIGTGGQTYTFNLPVFFTTIQTVAPTVGLITVSARQSATLNAAPSITRVDWNGISDTNGSSAVPQILVIGT